MLSVIILSNRDAYFERVKESILGTATQNVEIIRIKNVHGGIAGSYNSGASESQYPYLCFVHDDIVFHTKGWNLEVIRLLEKNNTGVLGVMGGRYKSAFGLGWRDGRTSFYRYNIKDGVEGGKHLSHYPDTEMISEVICLDGAFLCCRKEIWERFRFDDENFKGFHFYDIDFTFRVAQYYQNFTLNKVLLEHFSQGKTDEAYLKDALRFHELFKNRLPRSLETLSKKEIAQLEGYALSEKLRLLKKHNFSWNNRLKLLHKYLRRHFNFYQLIRNVYFGFVKP